MNRPREEKVHIFQLIAQENHYAKDSTELKWTLLRFLSSVPDLEKKKEKKRATSYFALSPFQN